MSMAKADLSRIDVVVPNLSARYSGVTSTIIALVPEHMKRIAIAAVGRNLPERLPNVSLGAVLRGGFRPPRGRRARIWHARRNIEMLTGLLLARVLRQPWKLVFTRAGQRSTTAYTRFLARRMDAVVATSPEAAAVMRMPATVVMHGVDTDRFHPAADRAAAFAATGLPGRYGIGIFGRVRPQKGTDLFVEAMLRLLPEAPDWTAVVIGLVQPEDRAFTDKLVRKVEEAGLATRIRFLGEQPVDTIPGWQRALSILVAPPRHEGFGLLPIEAMASGTPVVASRAGAHEACMIDGETGVLVPAGDGAALTAAIGRMMALAPAEREAIGAAGRRHVEAGFSIAREAERLEAIYKRLLES